MSGELKRLGDVIPMQGVKGAPADNPELPFLGMDDIDPAASVPSRFGRFGDMRSNGALYAEGDVLFGRLRPYLKKVYHAKENGAASAEFIVLPKSDELNGRFLAHALRDDRFIRFAMERSSGDRPRVSFDAIVDYELPVPNVEVQEKIADKIDQLYSRIDEGERALKAVETLVERYRQSVLKAAVTGELSRDWREAHQHEFGKSIETGEQLLARILKARRESWEKAELDKMIAKGKLPKSDAWKKKYNEPAKPKDGLPDLPSGWVWASLDQLLFRIDAGKSFRCEERPPHENQVGIVKVSAVSWGEFDPKESKTVVDADRVNTSYFIEPGDFLLSRANTIDLVGACVIAGQFSGRLMLSDKILRLKFHPAVQQQWVIQMLRSQLGRDQIEGLSTGNQDSMRNIGQQRIRQIAIPLPPVDEQLNSTESLERFRSQVLQIRKSLETRDEKASSLRQSVLCLAFKGGL